MRIDSGCSTMQNLKVCCVLRHIETERLSETTIAAAVLAHKQTPNCNLLRVTGKRLNGIDISVPARSLCKTAVE